MAMRSSINESTFKISALKVNSIWCYANLWLENFLIYGHNSDFQLNLSFLTVSLLFNA